MSDDRSEQQPEREGRTVAEWTTLGVCLAILALALAAITWLELGNDSGLTAIEVTPLADEAREEGDAWYLPVEVRNTGDRTAEDVVIEAELATAGGETETAEVTFTFLASGESARGTVIFTSEPAAGELTVRATSFKEP